MKRWTVVVEEKSFVLHTVDADTAEDAKAAVIEGDTNYKVIETEIVMVYEPEREDA